MNRILFSAIAFAVALIASPTLAQQGGPYDSSLAENDWYGPGVHDYYRGCYGLTVDQMTVAISLDDRDPRPYYYRGLANCAMGDCNAGQADIRMGARVEAMRSQRPMREVNRALERIQGYTRVEIERVRRYERLMVSRTVPGASQSGYNAPIGNTGYPQPGMNVPGQYTPPAAYPSGNPAAIPTFAEPVNQPAPVQPAPAQPTTQMQPAPAQTQPVPTQPAPVQMQQRPADATPFNAPAAAPDNGGDPFGTGAPDSGNGGSGVEDDPFG